MPSVRRTEVVCLVLLVAMILAAPAYAFDEVFQQTYPLSAGGSVELRNVNGSVQVSGWERDEVEVYALKSSRHDPGELKRVSIEVEAGKDSVGIQTRYPHDDGVEVYVEYHLRVPHRVQLNHLSTVNGAVRIFGVDAVGVLRSINGDIEVYDSAGRLSARTTNGNVRMELHQLDANGETSIETVNGSVLLSLPAGSGAELEVRSMNGDFRSEHPVTVHSTLGAREFRGRMGPGGSPLRIRTVNGGIRVAIARPVV